LLHFHFEFQLPVLPAIDELLQEMFNRQQHLA